MRCLSESCASFVNLYFDETSQIKYIRYLMKNCSLDVVVITKQLVEEKRGDIHKSG